MERGGLGRSLSSILSGAREVRDDDAGEPSDETPSLALAYQALTLLVEARRLRDAVVVLDDPTLGRQLLAAGRRPLTRADEALVDGPPGCWTEPAAEANDLELELVQRVCATALHAAVQAPERGSPVDAVELALRQLPGVYGAAVDAEDPIVEVYATGDTEPDLARRVGSLARAHLDDVLTVDLVRRATPSPSPLERPPSPPPAAPAPEPAAAAPALDEAPELLAAHTLPGYTTIEVLLRSNGAARVGHGPRRSGLAGAVAAALDALATPSLALLWVRTIRTTTAGQCTAAVALRSGAWASARYGTGDGANPIEAAARAAVRAVTNPDDGAPAGADLA
jgi:hypothetical protein